MDLHSVTHDPRRRQRAPRGVAFRVLGWWLVALFGVAFAAFGGVHTPTRALLHGMLAMGLVLAAMTPGRLLARTGHLRPYVVAGGALLGAVAIGLLPVPVAVLHRVAPGAVHSVGASWATLSTFPTSTLSELSHLLLLFGAGLVVAIWMIEGGRRSALEWAIAVGTSTLIAVAALHVLGRAQWLFGVVPTWVSPSHRFFAPFLNANHLASALLMALPVLIGMAWRRDAWRWEARRLFGLAALACIATILWIGSVGAIGVAAFVLLCVGVLTGGLNRWVLPAALAAAGASLVLFDPLAEHGRLTMWRATVGLWGGHWLFGSGGGTFDRAVGPYRTDTEFLSWAHAHNDLLEWGAETGLVGLAALGLALWLLYKAPRRSPHRATFLGLGLLGVALHSLVEFSLQVPALGMAAAAILASAVGLFGAREEVDARQVRRGLAGLAALQALAAGWQMRTSVEERALTALRGPAQRQALDELRTWAWWRGEIDVIEAQRAEKAGQSGRAVELARAAAAGHPAEAGVLREAALVLGRQGSVDEALQLTDAAVVLGPSDWRSRAVQASLLEQVAPRRAAAAWLDAVAREAPVELVQVGWHTLPTGLPWLEAAHDRSPWYVARLAGQLAKLGDPESALLAYDEVHVREPRRVYPAHARLLVEHGRIDDADEMLSEALQRAPGDRRHLRQLADIRERQERWSEAADLWLRLAEQDLSAQERAILATVRADGAVAALDLVGRLELRLGSAGIHPKARLAQGNLLLKQGRGAHCIDEVLASGLLDHERFGDQARRLLEGCRTVR